MKLILVILVWFAISIPPSQCTFKRLKKYYDNFEPLFNLFSDKPKHHKKSHHRDKYVHHKEIVKEVPVFIPVGHLYKHGGHHGFYDGLEHHGYGYQGHHGGYHHGGYHHGEDAGGHHGVYHGKYGGFLLGHGGFDEGLGGHGGFEGGRGGFEGGHVGFERGHGGFKDGHGGFLEGHEGFPEGHGGFDRGHGEIHDFF